MRYARCVWLTALIGILAMPAARSEEVLAVRVSPNICYEGCDVRVTVRVDRDPQNRVLTIEADSADYFRATEILLGGELAPLLHTLVLRSPPPGEYVIRATVVRADDETASSMTELRVVDILDTAPPR